MLEVRRKAFARDAAEFVHVRSTFTCALRFGEGGAEFDARRAPVAPGEHVALCRGAARAGGGVAGRRDDARNSCAALGRAHGA